MPPRPTPAQPHFPVALRVEGHSGIRRVGQAGDSLSEDTPPPARLADCRLALNAGPAGDFRTSLYYDAEWSVQSPVALELFKRAKIWEATGLDDFVRRVALLPLSEQPGTRFRYGISTDLLGAVVEKVSGLRLDQFFERRIFAPLDLRDTGFWVPPEKQTRLARVHTRQTGGRLALAPPDKRTPPGPGEGLLSGGGGLFSTAADYLRFAQLLLNGGELDGVRLLSRKTVELMTQNHIAHLANPHPFDRPEHGFGLGVRMVTDLGRSPTLGSAGMFGWDGAASTLVWMDPKEGTVALLLAQHLPYNQDDIFATFLNGVYAALVDQALPQNR